MSTKAIASITIPSLLLYLKNRQDPDYKEIPRWQRDLFWVTKIGQTYVRIPKPFLYGQVFGSMPERFMEYLDTQDPKAFDKLGKSLYDAISPVTGDPMSGLLPTAIKPLIENATNWNFFRQRPIVSESKQRLIPSEQYSRYDSETSKLVGRIFKISPSKVENLIQGYTGGSGKYGLQISDTIGDVFRRVIGGEKKPGKPIELSDIPLVKGFVASKSSESVQQFYDNKNKLNQVYSTWQKLNKEGKREEASKIKKDNPKLHYSSIFNTYSDMISSIGDKIDSVVNSKTYNDTIKRERINELEQRKVDLAKRANKLLH